MKIKFLTPVKGYGYFEGDVADIPDKQAKEMIAKKQAKPYSKNDDEPDDSDSKDQVGDNKE